jgi:hypothetical protein
MMSDELILRVWAFWRTGDFNRPEKTIPFSAIKIAGTISFVSKNYRSIKTKKVKKAV